MSTEMRFRDREEAGDLLAALLFEYEGRGDAIVLGLLRGGVPVAFRIARRLDLPLDVVVVRKIGAPGRRELAMGAIAGGTVIRNTNIIRMLGISSDEFDEALQRERLELGRQELQFRGNRPPPHLENRIVILVDDGLATGATMRAAIDWTRQNKAKKVVVAVPVAAHDTASEFRREVDSFVCPVVPSYMTAVGLWYDDFRPTSDDEVRDLLRQAAPVKSAGIAASRTRLE